MLKEPQYSVTSKSERPLIQYLGIDCTLNELMAEENVVKILEEEIPMIQHLASYTRQYPLRETLQNLKYDGQLIRRVEERKGVISLITGVYGRLEVINSGSCVDLNEATIIYLRERAKEVGILPYISNATGCIENR